MTGWLLAITLLSSFFSGVCFCVVAVSLAGANRRGGYIEPRRTP